MSLYMSLFKIMMAMRTNVFFRWVFDLQELLGIRIAISRFFNRLYLNKNFKNPSQQMKDSQKFFSENRNRVDFVESILDDDLSKKIYRSMVELRCESNYKKMPQNSFRSAYFGNDFFYYTDNEVFVDCGAFDGDSIRGFRKCMKKHHVNKYKIVAFEPDNLIFNKLICGGGG